jgi:NAD(P)-dependent dehydrogenase (short-subunit alcohol dehydrogenase family)
MHAWASIDWDDLGRTRRYAGAAAYRQSKLLNVLFTLALARRVAGTGVTANCVTPGLVRTRIGAKHTTRAHAFLHACTAMWGYGAPRGAEGLVYLASAPELAGVSGRYFVRTRAAQPAARALDVAAGERLWQLSASLTGLPVD